MKITESHFHLASTEVSSRGSHLKEPVWKDALCSAAHTEGLFWICTRKIKEYTSWGYVQIKTLFFKVFWCCKSTVFEPKQQREMLEGIESGFSQKVKQADEASLKKWWAVQYAGLHPKTQKMLLLEDVMCHAPRSEAEKIGWAEIHFDEFKEVATDFVCDLKIQTWGGKKYDPKQDLPKYLRAVITKLSS